MGCEKDMISDFISNLLAEHMPHTTYTLPSDVPLTLVSRRSDSLIVTGIIARLNWFVMPYSDVAFSLNQELEQIADRR